MSLRSAKYLSGRVFVLGLKGNGFETHRKHCVVSLSKVRKRVNIRNRYNQAPHLTQNTNGKVTTSRLDNANESPIPAGDHKASVNRRTRKQNKNKTEIT